MSDDNKSGSDLDIFEGLGKKSAGRVSAAPPPPASANLPAAPPAPPANNRAEMKRTLVGIPGPAQAPNVTAAPPPPPVSVSAPPPPPVSQGRVSSPPPLPSAARDSGSMRAAAPSIPSTPSKPPPPPARASLPNIAAVPSAQTLPSIPGPPATPASTNGASNRPPAVSYESDPEATQAAPSSPTASAAPAAPSTEPRSPAMNGGKLDMDWDDDNEATHVFDKDSKDDIDPMQGPESRRPEHASMDDILSSPRPIAPAAGMPPPQLSVSPSAPPPPVSSLSGAFGALGQPRQSNGASEFKSGAPPSQALRSAPPPPPASMRPQNASTSTAPIPPPPPPPGQQTTAPMHMPPFSQPPHTMPMNGQSSGFPAPPVIPSQSLAPQQPSLPPYQAPPVSQAPQSMPSQAPHMPPVSRAMELTAVVPRPQSRAGLFVALAVGVFAAMAIAVFLLMPRSGTIVVNVADSKGGVVSSLEVDVDGKQACVAAPCIVHDVSAGVHEVKVIAAGYDPQAPRAVTVEGKKDSQLEFSLSSGGAAGAGAVAASTSGTGLKATGNQPTVRLLVDGKEYGPLPQEVHDLSAGDHKVRFVGSDRYAALDKTVVVKQDEVFDLGNIQLKVVKGKATIQLGTPGAKVFLVNGPTRKEVPQFPIAIDFDPNEHWQLEAKAPGMDDYSSPISFDDGQAEKTITVTLNPKGTSVANAAPVTAQPPRAQSQAVWTPPPANNPAPAAPAPRPAAAPVAAAPAPAAAGGGDATLNINSKPASTVLLDGKPLGPTPLLKVSVSAGTHTVLFVNAEESLKKSVTVTVAAGDSKTVIGKLRD